MMLGGSETFLGRGQLEHSTYGLVGSASALRLARFSGKGWLASEYVSGIL